MSLATLLEKKLSLDPFAAAIEVIRASFDVGLVRGGLTEYLDGIQEEVDELRAALMNEHDSWEHIGEELGDVIFTTIILWCFLAGQNPQKWIAREPGQLLHATVKKFTQRLSIIENMLIPEASKEKSRSKMQQLSHGEWRKFWQKAKDVQRKNQSEKG